MQVKYKQGFTLIELMIVIAIIAIIAAVAVPQLTKSKKSTNEANAVTALKLYAEKQEEFRDRHASAGNSAVEGGYAANFRNLYYGNPVDDTGQPDRTKVLNLIPKDFADAFIVDPGTTNATPTEPATNPKQYQGYFFREPKELDPRSPEQFSDTFGLIAYPADSSTTGNRVYWIGPDRQVFYQDLPSGRQAEKDSEIDTPSGGSTTGWSGS